MFANQVHPSAPLKPMSSDAQFYAPSFLKAEMANAAKKSVNPEQHLQREQSVWRATKWVAAGLATVFMALAIHHHKDTMSVAVAGSMSIAGSFAALAARRRQHAARDLLIGAEAAAQAHIPALPKAEAYGRYLKGVVSDYNYGQWQIDPKNYEGNPIPFASSPSYIID